ncbi:MAG TPA: glycerophosphodiester phosphodiesterase [Cryptosporangiaceae bacterium]|nr:glycerophosphodiester phosphodiesterase [Cryptosporangiaceae bacterium]
MPSAFPYLDAPLPLAFAHRGGAAGGLENTMTAFSRAVDAGYRYVETDVHATADGALVAFHDPTLDRVTDRTGRIALLRLDQVRQARIGADERVPLLEDVLGAWPQLRVNVDVKADRSVEPLIETLRRTASLDRVCVGSFSDTRLARIRAALGPRLATALGPREVLSLRLSSWWRRADGAAPVVPCAQVPVRVGITVVDRRFVEHAHRSGLQVHVWTIDDPAEMNRLLDLGVDGIMTDRINVLREVYSARGLWAA